MKDKLSFPMYATVYTPGGAILKTGEIVVDNMFRDDCIINVQFKDNGEHYVTHISNVVITYTES